MREYKVGEWYRTEYYTYKIISGVVGKVEVRVSFYSNRESSNHSWSTRLLHNDLRSCALEAALKGWEI
jgi:hypothetical protein